MMDEKEIVDTSALYRLLAENCEHCKKPIVGKPETVWVDDPTQPRNERQAFFCNDDCFFAWWDAPDGENILTASNDTVPMNEASD